MIEIIKPNTPAFNTYGLIPTTRAIREVGPKYYTITEGGEWHRVHELLYLAIMQLPENRWKDIILVHSFAFGEPATCMYARWDKVNEWTDYPAECFY